MQRIPEESTGGVATAGRLAPASAGASAIQAGLRLRWALLAAVAGGVALAGAFPPAGIWPLAAAGPALLVIALYRQGLRASFVIGLVFGVAFFVPLLSWLVNVAWYAWATLAIAEAAIFGLLAVGQRLLLGLPGWPLAVGGWWVAAEAMRARWPYAFPWGRLAMSQAGAPTAGWAAIGGPPLLSFLVAVTGAMGAWLVLGIARDRRAARDRHGLLADRRRLVAAVAATAAIAGVALAGGLLPVDGAGAGAGQRTVTVAAVQGDVPHARSLSDLFQSYFSSRLRTCWLTAD